MSSTRSATRIATTALVAATLLASTFQSAHALRRPGSGPRPGAVTKTKNLIKNPGAESGTGSADGSEVAVPNWVKSNAGLTEVQYGAPGGFPDSNTPGPPKRGENFFAGGPGNGPFSVNLTQHINITRYAAAIKAGKVSFVLKGWLGGFANDPDSIRLDLEASGTYGDADWVSVEITNTKRHNQTKFLLQTVTGKFPRGTKTIDVVIAFFGSDNGPYNDGYADNLSLVLTGV
jgi:hypothetical protein